MANGGMATSYTVSIILGLLAAYAVNYFVPNLNPFIKFFIIPLVVIYIMLLLFRIIFPDHLSFQVRFLFFILFMISSF